jgi:hypothetical protein
VPELRYDNLPIADVATVTLELESLLFNGDNLTSETKALRGDLPLMTIATVCASA